MQRLQIKKNGELTNQADFPTREELDAWVKKHQDMGTFGKPERYEPQEIVIQPLVLDEDGNILQEEIREIRNVLVPSEWVYEYSDLTEDFKNQELKKSIRKDAKARIKALKDDDWKNVNTIAEVKVILRDIISAMEE